MLTPGLLELGSCVVVPVEVGEPAGLAKLLLRVADWLTTAAEVPFYLTRAGGVATSVAVLTALTRKALLFVVALTALTVTTLNDCEKSLGIVGHFFSWVGVS